MLVRYCQEDPNINGNVAHSTLHPFSVKHSSIASNSVSQLSGPAASTGYPQYQAPPTQFSPNSTGGVSSARGAIFSKDSQSSGAHDFLYVNGSDLSSDMIDGGMGDNPAIFMTRKPTVGAGTNSTGPAVHSHSLKTLASSLGVAGSRVSPPSELGMFAMAATSPPGPAGSAIGVNSNFSSANLSTVSNSSNLTSPLGFSPQSSSLSQQFSSYSQQHSSQSSSSGKQMTSSLLSPNSASSSASSLSSQNTYQNTHAPPPAAFSVAGNLGAAPGLGGVLGVNPLKYRTTSGAQSGVVQGYPKYGPGIKPEPPARTSSSLSSHQTAVAAATGVNSSAAGSQ